MEDYKLNINFNKLFGKEWASILSSLLSSEYMTNLLYFINDTYKKSIVYPLKKEIFDPFLFTPYNEIQVVIIGKEPYNNNQANSLAFSNEDNFGIRISPELIKIANNIEENVYDSFKMYFEYDLINWADQGILLLNSALTREKDKKDSHLIYWKNFTREVVKTINETKTGIIFCLWGREAQYFKKYINEDFHYVLQYGHPSIAVAENREWNCDHFIKINKILQDMNGKGSEIVW